VAQVGTEPFRCVPNRKGHSVGTLHWRVEHLGDHQLGWCITHPENPGVNPPGHGVGGGDTGTEPAEHLGGAQGSEGPDRVHSETTQ
jgi:hypothetical protein